MKQLMAAKWERYDRGPLEAPSEMVRLWQVALRKAGLPAATIPYALRRSSIVRGLRVGLSIPLVTALHDSSVIMIERHYSRWIVDGLDELAARAVVPLISNMASLSRYLDSKNILSRQICKFGYLNSEISYGFPCT